ncbi:MAG: winged helix-turn-helix domain-containing protein [Acidimicrobiia bacterium]
MRIVDPVRSSTVESLLDEIARQQGAGRVVLVAGAVPVEWRGRLRDGAASFIDASGVAEIEWPRLRVRARRFGTTTQRRTTAVPLQKSHALVAQELLIVASGGVQLTIGGIAEGAGVSLSSASRTVSQLAGHGLVTRHRHGREVLVSVVDPVQLAEHLAQRTPWGRREVVWGYLWGRNHLDVAARLSARADAAEFEVAITGRTGATFLGVLGTASPSAVRCWVNARPSLSALQIADALDLDEVPKADANVGVAVDAWRVGVHRAELATLDEWSAKVAHPVRVWCDLHTEQRGSEFAAQVWGAISHAW